MYELLHFLNFTHGLMVRKNHILHVSCISIIFSEICIYDDLIDTSEIGGQA
jgi:hypothetical protein